MNMSLSGNVLFTLSEFRLLTELRIKGLLKLSTKKEREVVRRVSLGGVFLPHQKVTRSRWTYPFSFPVVPRSTDLRRDGRPREGATRGKVEVP